MVVCQICHKSFKWINRLHLRSHDITMKEYAEMFPGIKVIDEDICSILSDQKKGDRNPMKREEVRKNNSLAHIGYKHSEESKRKISESHSGDRSYMKHVTDFTPYTKNLIKARLVLATTKKEEAYRKTAEKNRGQKRPQTSERLKVNNPMHNLEVRERHLQACRAPERVETQRVRALREDSPLRSPEALEKLAKTQSTKEHRDGCRQRMLTRMENNPDGFLAFMNSPTAGKSKHGYYISTKTGLEEYYHSSYELERFQQLDADSEVKMWTKSHHGLKIPYPIDGELHFYYPDILVTLRNDQLVLEEIKGYEQEKDKLKFEAAQSFCESKGMLFKVLKKEDLFS